MISSIKISNLGKNGFAFIVCNPPYVSASEMQELDPGVSKYEPHVALLGGNDGMEYYRILAAEGKKILKQGASIYCEIGYNQGEKVEKIFSEALWKNINIIKDLANRSRVVVASCNDL